MKNDEDVNSMNNEKYSKYFSEETCRALDGGKNTLVKATLDKYIKVREEKKPVKTPEIEPSKLIVSSQGILNFYSIVGNKPNNLPSRVKRNIGLKSVSDKINEILKADDLKSAEKVLYLALINMSFDSGIKAVWASNETLSNVCGGSIIARTVTRLLKSLKVKGYIHVKYFEDYKTGFNIPRIIYFDKSNLPNFNQILGLLLNDKALSKFKEQPYVSNHDK